METLELKVGDYTFSARADGPADGELVLLLHGFPETSYEWRKQLPVLAAAGYRAVAPDQRGYAAGARPENVDAYKIGELASDAVGFADALGVDRFHLVGHDWGGAVAWYVGGHYGDRLRTLTVVSTPHPTPFANSIAEGSSARSRRTCSCSATRAPRRCSSTTTRRCCAVSTRRAVCTTRTPPPSTCACSSSRSRSPVASTGTAPTTSAPTSGRSPCPRCTCGPPTTSRSAGKPRRRPAAYCEGPYRFEVIEGVSHWLPEEAPDQLNALLLSHLSGN